MYDKDFIDDCLLMVNKLEECTTVDSVRAICDLLYKCQNYQFLNSKFLAFIYENKILRNPSQTIYARYFKPIGEEVSCTLFRMMVVTEFFKTLGIEIMSNNEAKFKKVKCKISGKDGNAFAILGRVRRALKREGLDHLVEKYTNEATSGDYENLLRVTMQYVIDKE
jgi:hypothetical protein